MGRVIIIIGLDMAHIRNATSILISGMFCVSSADRVGRMGIGGGVV